ncbi:methylamine utilization protein [uncultured Oxalicibacterium sp.]|uniref:methylamine utilization protein n=1 Tax=uncultured Oxalicibacterium sp. TaxID=1168540 RepID=UPI0025CDA6ED|nr:methylamine utilization protein [uncultured Oxalicibacterium sp.]
MRLLSRLMALFCSLTAGATLAGSLDVTVLDDSGKPLPDAVVFLDSAPAKRMVKPLTGVQVAQKDLRFVPALLVVTTGTAVSFPNMDSVRHHVYSFSSAKRFELKLYVGTPLEPVVFDQPGAVVLGCNIHDQMIGYLLVVDTPFYGLTNEEGKVSLHDLPTAASTLRVWHSRLINSAQPQSQAIQVDGNNKTQTVSLKKLRK